MKVNLRKRYVLWMLLMIVSLVALQFLAFAIYELAEINSWKNTEEVEEEVGEIVVLLAVDAVILPLVFLISWVISGRMLQPLHAVADTAERISSGRLQERITTPIPDDEMAALVQSVNLAFDKYHGVLRQLEQFTSDASHQLRTPLAAMRMLGEVSLQRARTPEDYRETIGGMLEETARMGDIVEKLLLLARLEPQRVRERFAEVEVSRLAAEVVESFSLFAQDKGVALKAEATAGLRVQGDAGLLRQALSNLLDNALRHTPAGGWITVRVDRDGEGIRLEVQDSGPGIPAEFRERIFERFVRVPGSPASGSGLGLAIVANILRVHGGTVSLVDTAAGAHFELRLPASG